MVYYLNHEQIGEKHDFLIWLADVSRQVQEAYLRNPGVVSALAQERVLHLAIETATDLANLLIDGFMMRDPSSYEDIIDILATEQVLDSETAALMCQLVRERKLLQQSFIELDRDKMHPILPQIPQLLTTFAKQCVEYVKANQL